MPVTTSSDMRRRRQPPGPAQKCYVGAADQLQPGKAGQPSARRSLDGKIVLITDFVRFKDGLSQWPLAILPCTRITVPFGPVLLDTWRLPSLIGAARPASSLLLISKRPGLPAGLMCVIRNGIGNVSLSEYPLDQQIVEMLPNVICNYHPPHGAQLHRFYFWQAVNASFWRIILIACPIAVV